MTYLALSFSLSCSVLTAALLIPGVQCASDEQSELIRFDTNREFTHHTTQAGFPHNRVWAIHKDRDDTLWNGTGGELARMDRGKLAAYNQKDGFSHSTVKTIYGDEKNIVRTGTDGGKWARFADQKISVLSIHAYRLQPFFYWGFWPNATESHARCTTL
jgi:hypothetical protein